MAAARLRDAGWTGIAALGLAVTLVLVRLVNARFLLSGDKQSLYLPVMRDIGRRLRDGELPAVDPDLGPAGNFALNLQFGIYEPLQLLGALLLSAADDLLLASWLWSAGLLLVLCVGTCALLLRLQVPGGWAAAGGLGVSLAGYTLYQLAPSWVSALGSLVWLPWWWRCWYGRSGSRAALAGLGVFGYLLVATGWPFTWLAAAFVGIGMVAEELIRRPGDNAPPGARRSFWGQLSSRVLASLGGALAGCTVAVPLLGALDYTVRSTDISDDGRFRPNLADLVSVASPSHTLYSEIGNVPVTVGPIFFVAWFVVVLVWGVAWSRSTLRVPGVVSAGIATLLAALMTQMPALLGPLRQGLRNLEAFQLCLVVLVIVAYSGTPARWSRGRVTGAVLSAVVTGYLAWAQQPQQAAVLVGAALVLGCAVVLVALLVRLHRGAGPLARAAWLPAVFALVTTVGLTGWMVRTSPAPNGVDHGLSAKPPQTPPGAAAGVPTIALYPKVDSETSLALYRDGVGYGFTRLSDSYRPFNGTSSIGQEPLNRILCLNWYGVSCPSIGRRLMSVEPTTGRRWIDLLGIEQVQVTGAEHRKLWARASKGVWQRVDRVGDVLVYDRMKPLATVGRVTDIDGPGTVTAREVGNARQTYEVTGAETATRLVFRDVFWPGYRATLDGEPLAVTPVAESLVSVTIPPGRSGELAVSYSPAGRGVMLALWGAGGLLFLLGLLLGSATRSRDPATGVEQGARGPTRPSVGGTGKTQDVGVPGGVRSTGP